MGKDRAASTRPWHRCSLESGRCWQVVCQNPYGKFDQQWHLPLQFKNPADYDHLGLLDELIIENAEAQIRDLASGQPLAVLNRTIVSIACSSDLSDRQARILLAGGLLNNTRAREQTGLIKEERPIMLDDNQKMVKDLANNTVARSQITTSLYERYSVKRSLRNEGTGVLVGLTEIGEVFSYIMDDNDRIGQKAVCFTVE